MEVNTIKEFNYKGFDCFINRVGFYKSQSVREAININCNHFGDGDKENTEEFVLSEIKRVVDRITDPDNDLRGLLDDMAWGEG